MKKIWLAKTLLAVFSITLIYSLYHLITWEKDNLSTSTNLKKIQEVSQKEIKEDETISIDFNNLLQQNDEVVGWIKVNNTNIDYPIVKHQDNSYYLNHSFDKSSNGAGWIFMDNRNNPEILDFNTIIYGHGRKDGSMFGSLMNTLNEEWIKKEENKIIKLTTLNHSYLFKIFSIYYINTTDDYITITYDAKILEKIINRSIYKLNEQVDENDKILTLSTCYNDEKKLVVHAKLTYTN